VGNLNGYVNDSSGQKAPQRKLISKGKVEHEQKNEDLNDGDGCLPWRASRSYSDRAIDAARHDAGRHERASSETVQDDERLTQEMTGMTEQMSRADVIPDQRKQMALRMEAMSGMMHRMSGFEAMPAMMEPEQQKQMHEMRTQMDEMMISSSMEPGPKWRLDCVALPAEGRSWPVSP